MAPARRPAKSPDDKLTTTDIRAEYGIEINTWWSYVSVGRAPKPVDPHGGRFGRTSWWYRRVLDEWSKRPGRGARLDLARDDPGSELDLTVACSVCGAARGKPCQTKAGRPAARAHKPRRLEAERLAASAKAST